MRRSRRNCTKAAFAAVAVIATLAGTTARGGARGNADPDIVTVLNDFFKSNASADAKEALGWTKAPTPIVMCDALDDHFALDPASSDYKPPEADQTGAAMARTDALDATTFEGLFGADGALAKGAPMVRYPQTFDVDVQAFRAGMLVTTIFPRAPYGALDGNFDSFIASVNAFDPRYPSPPNDPFQRINKGWRFEVTPQGSDVDYRQFDGTQFPAYLSQTIVLDTCGADSTVDTCFFTFFTATSGVEVEGITEVRVELFLQQGERQAADRNGAGFGEPQPFPGVIEPGTFGWLPLAQPQPEEPELQPQPGDDDASSPRAVAVDSSGGDSGFPVVPVAIVGTGAALVGTGVVMVRRRRAPDPPLQSTALAYTGAEPIAPVDESRIRARWAQLLAQEEQIQQRLLTQYTRVAEPLAQGLRTLAGAMNTYQDGFGDVLWEAKNLQRISDENQASMRVTQKIDLVLGVADAGRTVWSFGTWGWTKLFGAGDEAVEVVSDAAVAAGRGTAYGSAELAIANAKIAESPQLLEIANAAGMVTISKNIHWTKFNRGLDVIFTEAAVLADRAGVDFVSAATSRANAVMSAGDLEQGIVALWVDMAEASAQANGFVKASDETRELLSAITVNARAYCNGGVVGSMDELRGVVDGFAGVAAQPGFLNTAPNLYTIVGGAGDGLSGLGRGDTALELLYNADDVFFMNWLSDTVNAGHSVDELPALWQATMGPIARAGDNIAQGVAGASGTATIYSVTQGINSTMQVFTPFTTPTTVSSILPDANSYVAQYGIMNPTFLGYEAGDSLGLTLLYNGLNGAGGFSTWLNGMRASLEADLLYTGGPPILGDLAALVLPEGAVGNLMDDVQPTLHSMAGASVDIVNALEVISERTQMSQISIDDRRALESVLGEMEATVIGAPQSIEDELRPQFDERKAHITTKLRQLESVQSTLVTAGQQLPAIARALDEQVSAGRTTIQWADPVLLQGFTVATNVVNMIGANVLHPPVGPASTEEDDDADPQ